jgi:DNA-binding GntR family transcriptional regulator
VTKDFIASIFVHDYLFHARASHRIHNEYQAQTFEPFLLIVSHIRLHDLAASGSPWQHRQQYEQLAFPDLLESHIRYVNAPPC